MVNWSLPIDERWMRSSMIGNGAVFSPNLPTILKTSGMFVERSIWMSSENTNVQAEASKGGDWGTSNQD